jgi:hypothetical protein
MCVCIALRCVHNTQLHNAGARTARSRVALSTSMYIHYCTAQHGGPPVDGGQPGGRRTGGHPGGRRTGGHSGGRHTTDGHTLSRCGGRRTKRGADIQGAWAKTGYMRGVWAEGDIIYQHKRVHKFGPEGVFTNGYVGT